MARFQPGDRVTVRGAYPRKGHIRTPFYCRGKTGTVERVCGAFENPEQLAFGIPAVHQPLYRVRFAQNHVWPDYKGPALDHVEIEIYEHWLVPAQGSKAA